MTRQTLHGHHRPSGELGYGDTRSTPVNRLAGTVTWMRRAGARWCAAASRCYEVDDSPGRAAVRQRARVPRAGHGHRGRRREAAGAEPQALGYTGFTVDKEFTASTAAAVKKWQDDLGLTETGGWTRAGLGPGGPGRTRDEVGGQTGAGRPVLPTGPARGATGADVSPRPTGRRQPDADPEGHQRLTVQGARRRACDGGTVTAAGRRSSAAPRRGERVAAAAEAVG